MALLELRSVAKHFGAIEALKGVDLDLEPGEVLGLMGDNGAGKSTLVKIVAGSLRPTHGQIFLDGEARDFHRPREAQQAGIEIVYQDLALCDNLSAASNVFLGRELMHSRDYSDETASEIDHEVRRLLNQALERSKRAIEENRPYLDTLAQRLLDVETLRRDEIQALLAGVHREGRPVPPEPLPSLDGASAATPTDVPASD